MLLDTELRPDTRVLKVQAGYINYLGTNLLPLTQMLIIEIKNVQIKIIPTI